MSKNSEHIPHYVPPRQDWSASERITNAGSDAKYVEADDRKGYIRPERLRAFTLPSLINGRRVYPRGGEGEK
jgi:hypothetical protein